MKKQTYTTLSARKSWVWVPTTVTSFGLFLLPHQVSALPFTQELSTTQATSRVVPSAIPVFTGTWGTSPITVTSDGLLYVGAGILSGSLVDRLGQIGVNPNLFTKIVFTGSVTFPVNSSYLFADLFDLTSITGLQSVNTRAVTDMTGLFSGDSHLTSLDLSRFNTSRVTNMSMMFNNCQSLTRLDLSTFDTRQVKNMSGMFSLTLSLTTINLTSLKTSQVTDMSHMFGDTGVKSLDLTHFDTSRVTNMSGMFDNAYQLESVDLSRFNTRQVLDMSRMFEATTALTSLDLSSFDTHGLNRSPESASAMFGPNLHSLTLGKNFVFYNGESFGLTDVTRMTSYDSSLYTGYWENVGSGNAEVPNGGQVLTSYELMYDYKGESMAGTYAWQPRSSLQSPSHQYPTVIQVLDLTESATIYQQGGRMDGVYKVAPFGLPGSLGANLDGPSYNGQTVTVTKEETVTYPNGGETTYAYVTIGHGSTYGNSFWIDKGALISNQPQNTATLSDVKTVNYLATIYQIGRIDGIYPETPYGLPGSLAANQDGIGYHKVGVKVTEEEKVTYPDGGVTIYAYVTTNTPQTPPRSFWIDKAALKE